MLRWEEPDVETPWLCGMVATFCSSSVQFLRCLAGGGVCSGFYGCWGGILTFLYHSRGLYITSCRLVR